MNILNLTVDDHVAILTIDQPGSTTNRISHSMMTSFGDFLDEAEQNTSLRAIIMHSTKKDSFIAGADIRLFLGFKNQDNALAFSLEGNRLLSRLQALPVPVIAAIHGATHGGGLEVALACHYRIASDHPSTRFSLPEVTLGLCPAAGGSQRLPELVGIGKALPMLLTGRAVTATEALDIGLVNDLVSKSGLLQAAKVVAGRLAGDASAWGKMACKHQSDIDPNAVRSAVQSTVQDSAANTVQNTPSDATQDSATDAVQNSAADAVQDSAADAVQDSTANDPDGDSGPGAADRSKAEADHDNSSGEWNRLQNIAKAPLSLLTRAARTMKGSIIERRPVFMKAEKELQMKTRGLCPAPIGILECVRYGLKNGREAGLQFESSMFSELATTAESRQLLYAFLARHSSRKNPSRTKPREVSSLGILGTGLMGSGIASLSVRKGFSITVRDRDFTSASRAKQTAWQDLQQLVNRKAMLPFERDRILSKIRLSDNYDDFAGLPLVIEAVVEDISVKHAVLREAESVISDETIFATNTSAIPIAEIAKVARRPERVIGMHYFSPAQKMPLVEIIRGEKTGEDVVATACDVAIRQGKHVIVVGDAPGFYVTRIILPMINEAMLLIAEGADIRIVDTAVMNFGFPVGPVTLVDQVGIDVVSHIMEEMNSLFKKRGSRISQSIHRLYESGYAGRKNRRGFYNYVRSRNQKQVNEEIYTYFGNKKRRDFSLNEIMERITMVMINEALHCLQDGVIDQPRTGDIGAMLGMGFPGFRGGPFRYLDSSGHKKMWDRMQFLHSLHGVRFKPAEILGDHVKSGKLFYP